MIAKLLPCSVMLIGKTEIKPVKNRIEVINESPMYVILFFIYSTILLEIILSYYVLLFKHRSMVAVLG